MQSGIKPKPHHRGKWYRYRDRWMRARDIGKQIYLKMIKERTNTETVPKSCPSLRYVINWLHSYKGGAKMHSGTYTTGICEVFRSVLQNLYVETLCGHYTH
jgi:hypothetical protein